ncbi:hypothetical protein [Actinoplanes solisilvae]|uniref:hypothetical protein n=1 Tax=Actinoplanes solisilvae TaxID=2486853 RepID=UPI000FD7BD4D|nr:hypothetical protein [Actinoplanes solisilvae]
MSTQDTVVAIGGGDDLIERAGRWLLAKVWLGCLLSGGYAAGNHFGWPQGVRALTALLAAVALAAVAVWLPLWTRQRPSGVAVVDIGVRALAWAGLTISVAGLLAGSPAVGAVAGALLLSTAWRTFGDKLVHPARCPGCGHRPAAGSETRWPATAAAESRRVDGGISAGPSVRRPSRGSVPRRGGGSASPAPRSTPPRPSRR